jgi:hypothetical protein
MNNPDFPPEFHVRRGMIQSTIYEEEKRILKNFQQEVIPLDENQMKMKRTKESLALLSKGFSIGAFSGFTIGTIYALRTKQNHSRVFSVGLYSAYSLSSLTTLFTAIKYLIPDAIHRRKFDFSFLNAPGGMDPSFLSDLTPRETDLLSTFLSGSISGSIVTFLHALRNARINNLTVGHVIPTGFKGGLFWGSALTSLHYCYMLSYEFFKSAKMDQKIRNLYKENPEVLMEISGCSDIHDKIPKSWGEIARDEVSKLVQYLPFVYDESDYNYRLDLERKEKDLVEEVKVYQKKLEQIKS